MKKTRFTEEETELFKEIRSTYFKGSDLRKKIKKAYENKYGKLTEDKILKNASNIIEHFNNFAKENWFLFKSTMQKNIFRIFCENQKEYKKRFPNISKKIISILNMNKNKIIKMKPEDLLFYYHENTFNLSTKFEWSNIQFAKQLTGTMLEHYFLTLLDILKIDYETQKPFFSKGQVNDFIIPNVKYGKKNPENAYVVESQSTLKDRFRLTTGKAKGESTINRVIITLTGKGIVNRSDKNDLTDDKIFEFEKSFWKVVVLKDVKNDSRIAKHKNVISFENFFSELLEKNKIYKTK